MKLKDVKERLSRSSSIHELKERDREHVWRFLKAIGLQGTWIRSILRREGLRSNQYVLGTKWWLLQKGFIREKAERRKKILTLTEKGEDALIKLDSYYVSPRNGKLKIFVDLGGQKAEVAVELKSSKRKKGLTVSESISALTAPRLYGRLLGFATFFAINSANEDSRRIGVDNVSIDVKPGEIDNDIILFLISLWERYREIINGRHLGKDELLERFYDSLRLAQSSSIELSPYWKYWRRVEDEARSQIQKGRKIDFSFLPFPKVLLEEKNVRSWIDKRLDDDPDWFMPHFLWVQLGFGQRKNVDKPSLAHPPYFICVGKFYEMAGVLKRELDAAQSIKMGGKQGSSLLLHEILKKELGVPPDDTQVAHVLLAPSLIDHQNKSEFYEAWKIIREEYKDSFPEVSRILDAALLRYVYAGEKPDVDLDPVFEDLVLRRYSYVEIADKIRDEFYKLKQPDKEIDKTAEYEKMLARKFYNRLKEKGFLYEETGN
jgi:predicted transcriptional regulator